MLYYQYKQYDIETVMPDKIGLDRPVSDRNYLYFQSEQGVTKVILKEPPGFNISLQYSTNGIDWNTWQKTSYGVFNLFNEITLQNRGDYVFIRAAGTNTWSASSSDYLNFKLLGGKVSAGGSVTSLLSSTADGKSLSGKNYCFYRLFDGCASLTRAPELPATTLDTYCYTSMFNGCTALTTAPALPAETLLRNCYQSMFYGCTSLTAAPELPAKTLVQACYKQMFYGCSNLDAITTHMTDISDSDCLTDWLASVSTTGDFYCDSSLSISSGTSGIPSGWTRHDLV